jgi:hypothetical protein
MFAVSALNSRVRASEMISLKKKRWIATTAIIPDSVLAKLKPSKNIKTTKKMRSMKTATP